MSSLPITFDYNDAIMNHHFHLPIAVFKKPETEDESKSLESVLEKLIDVVRDDESHSLAIASKLLVTTLSVMILKSIKILAMIFQILKWYNI